MSACDGTLTHRDSCCTSCRLAVLSISVKDRALGLTVGRDVDIYIEYCPLSTAVSRVRADSESIATVAYRLPNAEHVSCR